MSSIYFVNGLKGGKPLKSINLVNVNSIDTFGVKEIIFQFRDGKEASWTFDTMEDRDIVLHDLLNKITSSQVKGV